MNSQRQGYEGWWLARRTWVLKNAIKSFFYVEFVHLYRCIFSVSI